MGNREMMANWARTRLLAYAMTRRKSRQDATVRLARRCVGNVEPGVGSRPDSGYATAGANEQSGRRQANKSKQQCIFDQVLSLLITKKLGQQCFHGFIPYNS